VNDQDRLRLIQIRERELELQGPQPTPQLQAKAQVPTSFNEVNPQITEAGFPVDKGANAQPLGVGDVPVLPEQRIDTPEVISQPDGDAFSYLGETLKNVPESFRGYVGNVAQTILHPIDTATSLKDLGLGLAQLMVPGEQGKERLARSVGSFFKDRYGSLNAIKETFRDDPIGFLSDFSAVLSGAGFATKLTKVTAFGKELQAFGKSIEPSRALLVSGSKLLAKKERINSLAKTALDLPRAKGLQRVDELAEAFINKGLNINRKSLIKLDRESSKIRKSVNSIIDTKTKDGIMIKTDDIVKSLDGLIDTAAKEGLELPDIKVIQRMRQQFKSLHGETLTPREIQDIKVGFNKGFKPDLSSRFGQVRAKVRNTLRDAAKSKLEELHPELKLLNKSEGINIELTKAIKDRIISFEKKPMIPVRGLVAGGLAGAIGGYGAGLGAGVKFATGAIIVDKLITDPRIQIVLAKALAKARTKAFKVGGVAPSAFRAGRAEETISGAQPPVMRTRQQQTPEARPTPPPIGLQGLRGTSTLR